MRIGANWPSNRPCVSLPDRRKAHRNVRATGKTGFTHSDATLKQLVLSGCVAYSHKTSIRTGFITKRVGHDKPRPALHAHIRAGATSFLMTVQIVLR